MEEKNCSFARSRGPRITSDVRAADAFRKRLFIARKIAKSAISGDHPSGTAEKKVPVLLSSDR